MTSLQAGDRVRWRHVAYGTLCGYVDELSPLADGSGMGAWVTWETQDGRPILAGRARNLLPAGFACRDLERAEAEGLRAAIETLREGRVAA